MTKHTKPEPTKSVQALFSLIDIQTFGCEIDISPAAARKTAHTLWQQYHCHIIHIGARGTRHD